MACRVESRLRSDQVKDDQSGIVATCQPACDVRSHELFGIGSDSVRMRNRRVRRSVETHDELGRREETQQEASLLDSGVNSRSDDWQITLHLHLTHFSSSA